MEFVLALKISVKEYRRTQLVFEQTFVNTGFFFFYYYYLLEKLKYFSALRLCPTINQNNDGESTRFGSNTRVENYIRIEKLSTHST